MIKIYYIIFIYLLFILFNNKCKFNNKLEPYLDTNKIKNVYFITFYNNKERLNNVQNIIKKYKLHDKATIAKAVIGSELKYNTNLLNKYFTNKGNNVLGHNEKGCSMSHILLWKLLLKQDKPYMIIFEDDATFDYETLPKLNSFINNVPNDFDICQIWHHYKFKKTRLQSKYNLDSKYIMKGYPQDGLVGYIISKNGARILLNNIIPMNSAIDELIKQQIIKKNITAYCPIDDIIYMPFKLASTIRIQNNNKIIKKL